MRTVQFVFNPPMSPDIITIYLPDLFQLRYITRSWMICSSAVETTTKTE